MQRCEDASARLLTLQNETSATNERVLEKKKAIKKIEKDLTDLNQMRLDLGDKKESLENRKQELIDAMDKHDTIVDELHAQLSAKRSRLESLEEIQAKFEGFALGTKTVMEHAESGQADFSVVELLADAIDVPVGMEKAVEAALGDKLGAVVVKSKSTALKAIEYLKQKAKGKAAFYAVDDMATGMAKVHGENTHSMFWDKVKRQIQVRPLACQSFVLLESLIFPMARLCFRVCMLWMIWRTLGK